MRRAKIEKKRNGMCTTSFVLGLLSIFIGFIYILPILSIIFGIIGISKFDNEHQKSKWMGVVGLILGIAYLMVYVINLSQGY